MVLTGKQKAVAAFVITLVLGVIGAVLLFSGLPVEVKPYLQLAVSIITIIGTTLGVYQTTNNPVTKPVDPKLADDTDV